MTSRLIFAVILLILATNVDAQYVSGDTLHDLCQVEVIETEFEPTCVFFIVGALDMYHDLQHSKNIPEPVFCTPDTAYRLQSVEVVSKYLESHPDTRNMEAVALILVAMSKAFPCEADKTPDS